MSKLLLSSILLVSFCALIFSSCAKTDNTVGPAGPMTASYTLPAKSPVPFIGSSVSASVMNNNDSNKHDSTMVFTGHIYKPHTIQDSIMSITISVLKYKAGMGGTAIDNDTFAIATLIDSSGNIHIASEGSVIFNAATAYGATGTFSFKCADGVSVTDGWFLASWRGQ